MNYSLIITILNEMDNILVVSTIYNSSYSWLCVCLSRVCVLLKIQEECSEANWIKSHINKTLVGHSTLNTTLAVAKSIASVTHLECYYLRKYLIRRWIGEARLCMSESTSIASPLPLRVTK